ncbi:MFS transporter [Leucobacter sp. OLJS4]|uniref:MFS transporter n=1 Tax=unclassified Leucobacter TaxID=2621730 RepID=UPI000C49A3AF|nr:MFS transporter [Leucobacter sp. OLCALW19]PII88345.1 MFS transporter [Leucobacter sp. OLTLW20]PII92288.1 MFS transporter [Leucobacter sp. OLAS13]PII99535.1 MFS transporter [Leucobacter sp. OLCS4]PII99729.1 MFS transporter [Leucobacter sp. OLDS2]PIJ02931.1 MFS transporter [Leucobacter sp. OLIS6]PIJ11021.1 MFS transporter [Leucobacter sp. OLJS4]PIJ54039.1 MFS transporter [Leucobacter sp. OAMSW11]
MSATNPPAASPTAPSHPRNKPAQVILASLIGTTIEFYDFYVYATAAVLVFPVLFFPTGNETTALVASFATFGAAMLARPIGAVFFGHLGDRLGRKTTLVASLLTMGIATFLIGLLPTHENIGVWAAVLLLILRLAQGFALGGEWSGAALVATENAPEGKRAWYGTFPQLGAPIGFIIANMLFYAINLGLADPSKPGIASEAFLQWGWRVPFLFSAVMVIVGLWVRLRLVESNAFERTRETGQVKRMPLAEAFTRHWKALILGTFAMLATYVLFYLMTSFTLTLGTRPGLDAAKAAAEKAGTPFDAASYVPGLGYSYNDFILMLVFGVLFFGVFTLVSGPLADRYGRRRTLIWVTAAIALFGFTFVPLLGGGTATVIFFLALGFTLMGLTFGPMGAFLPEMFPTNVRYTGSAIAYNVSSILGAALAPIIAVWLWGLAGGSPVLVGLYLTGAAVLTLVSLILTPETKDVDIEA